HDLPFSAERGAVGGCFKQVMLTSLALALFLQQEPFLDEVPLDQDERSRQEDPFRKEAQENPLPKEGIGVYTPWDSEYFPNSDTSRNSLADPLPPRSGSKVEMPIRKKDDVKFEGALGSQRTIWRSASRSGNEAMDVGVEAAVVTRFDINQAW